MNNNYPKKPIFLIRMSSIGDVIIAAKNVQYFVENDFEPIFVSSLAMIDILLQVDNLKHILCIDKNQTIVYFVDGQKKSINAIKSLFDVSNEALFCDLQNTSRSHRMIKKIKYTLFNNYKINIFSVKKRTFFRFFLIFLAKINLFQTPQRKNKKQLIRIHDLQQDVINKIFLQHQKHAVFLHSNTTYLSKKFYSNIKYISLFPGASGALKMWPKKHFINLIHLILENTEFDIYICGGIEDKLKFLDLNQDTFSSKRIHNVVGIYSLSETLEHIANSSYIVSNDSFPGHAADAYQIPGTIIFGSTSPDFGFVPLYSKIEIKYLNLSCSPCSRHGKGVCRYKNMKCLEQITPMDILLNIKKHLKSMTCLQNKH